MSNIAVNKKLKGGVRFNIQFKRISCVTTWTGGLATGETRRLLQKVWRGKMKNNRQNAKCPNSLTRNWISAALKNVLQKRRSVQLWIVAEVQFCKKQFLFVSLNLKKNIVSLSGWREFEKLWVFPEMQLSRCQSNAARGFSTSFHPENLILPSSYLYWLFSLCSAYCQTTHGLNILFTINPVQVWSSIISCLTQCAEKVAILEYIPLYS